MSQQPRVRFSNVFFETKPKQAIMKKELAAKSDPEKTVYFYKRTAKSDNVYLMDNTISQIQADAIIKDFELSLITYEQAAAYMDTAPRPRTVSAGGSRKKPESAKTEQFSAYTQIDAKSIANVFEAVVAKMYEKENHAAKEGKQVSHATITGAMYEQVSFVVRNNFTKVVGESGRLVQAKPPKYIDKDGKLLPVSAYEEELAAYIKLKDPSGTGGYVHIRVRNTNKAGERIERAQTRQVKNPAQYGTALHTQSGFAYYFKDNTLPKVPQPRGKKAATTRAPVATGPANLQMAFNASRK